MIKKSKNPKVEKGIAIMKQFILVGVGALILKAVLEGFLQFDSSIAFMISLLIFAAGLYFVVMGNKEIREGCRLLIKGKQKEKEPVDFSDIPDLESENPLEQIEKVDEN